MSRLLFPGVLQHQRNVSMLKYGLVSCWEMDETSGTTAVDSHGDNDGAIQNITIDQSVSPTNLGKSYLLNNAYSRVILNQSQIKNLWDIGNTVTVSAWVNRNIVNTTDGWIFIKPFTSNIAPYYQIGLYCRRNAAPTHAFMAIIYWADTGALQCWDNTAKDINTWYHLVAVYKIVQNNWSIKLYINGSLNSQFSTTDTKSYTNYSTNTYIGRHEITAGTYAFPGYIPQVSMWNRELTASEVKRLYNAGNGLAYTNW